VLLVGGVDTQLNWPLGSGRLDSGVVQMYSREGGGVYGSSSPAITLQTSFSNVERPAISVHIGSLFMSSTG
jgi:hypothetical protein